MHTAFSGNNEFAHHNSRLVWVPRKFESEADAVTYTTNNLIACGFDVKCEVNIKGAGVVDLVAIKNVDGHRVIFPIECKKWFDSCGEVARATMQANSYAEACGYPVFIGPFVWEQRMQIGRGMSERLQEYASFMCRLNVGWLSFSDNGSSLAFHTEAGIGPMYKHHFDHFDGKVKEVFRPEKWGMRTRTGSKSKLTPIIKEQK